MFGSDILDVVIALAFIYFLLSIVASAVQELIAQVVSWRARTLRSGIANLLGDPTFTGLAGMVYAHPLVTSLGTKPRSIPSYLKNTTFSDALIESVSTASVATETTIETVKAGIAALPDGPAKTQLQVLLRESGDQLDALKLQIASWFDDGMDRLKGVYTRHTRLVLLVTGIVLAVLFNIDSVGTAQTLAANPASRDAIVASVSTATETGEPVLDPGTAVVLLNELGSGIGWDVCWYESGPPSNAAQPTETTACGVNLSGTWPSTEAWVSYGLGRVPGWLFTAFAVMLGAPFWFDTLQRLAHLRATGPAPNEK